MILMMLAALLLSLDSQQGQAIFNNPLRFGFECQKFALCQGTTSVVPKAARKKGVLTPEVSQLGCGCHFLKQALKNPRQNPHTHGAASPPLVALLSSEFSGRGRNTSSLSR